jgi:hypothetical protein
MAAMWSLAIGVIRIEGGGAGTAVGSSRAAGNGPRPSGVSGAVAVRTGEGSGHGRRERRGERD